MTELLAGLVASQRASSDHREDGLGPTETRRRISSRARGSGQPSGLRCLRLTTGLVASSRAGGRAGAGARSSSIS